MMLKVSVVEEGPVRKLKKNLRERKRGGKPGENGKEPERESILPKK